MRGMTIGKLAKEAQVGIETIRFYEREGLLEPPLRRPSGYRQYSEGVIDRLRFIKRGKELGFSLKEIKELLSLRATPGSTCDQVKSQAQAKLEAIEAKIRDLQRMKRALKKLTTACRGEGSVSECPILEAMENKTRKRRTS
ncbi:MAG TPA: heavy metal-responsive transcriptional regulator [Planctomycetes bacterium]|nr:heavy metal-responsive transcriptional regulator [Planctomycetota bacterium]